MALRAITLALAIQPKVEWRVHIQSRQSKRSNIAIDIRSFAFRVREAANNR